MTGKKHRDEEIGLSVLAVAEHVESVVEARVSLLRGDHENLLNFVDTRIGGAEKRVWSGIGLLTACFLGAIGFSTNLAVDKFQQIEKEIVVPLTAFGTHQMDVENKVRINNDDIATLDNSFSKHEKEWIVHRTKHE
jgi:hypothetical protein